MLTNEKVINSDYIIAFRNILREAERREKEALDRFGGLRIWEAWRMEISNSFSEKVYIKSAASVHRENPFINPKLLKKCVE